MIVIMSKEIMKDRKDKTMIKVVEKLEANLLNLRF
jgi:hypothetical protein